MTKKCKKCQKVMKSVENGKTKVMKKWQKYAENHWKVAMSDGMWCYWQKVMRSDRKWQKVAESVKKYETDKSRKAVKVTISDEKWWKIVGSETLFCHATPFLLCNLIFSMQPHFCMQHHFCHEHGFAMQHRFYHAASFSL